MQTKITLSDGTSFNESIPRLPNTGSFDDSLVDLHSVANSIFLAEKFIKCSCDISKVEIPLRGEFSSELKEALEDLYTGLFDYAPNFVSGTKELSFRRGKESWTNEHACLFSCGLDSYSAILSASKLFPVSGVFTLHSDFHTLPYRRDTLEKKVLKSNNIEIITIKAPPHYSATKLTRGVLYVLNTALLRKKNIIVPEIGPTMYQPKFSLLDEISVTTRPEILSISKKIIKSVTGESINLIKPNEDLTKAEVAANSPNPEFVEETHSCRTPRWANSDVSHCGSCFGCIVRRLATKVAGVVDSQYRNNGFNGEGADNITQLIRFSIDFLTNPETLHWYTTEIISKYHKQDLFKRFALDNLAGLIIMSDEGIVNNLQRRLFALTLESVDRNELNERIEVVRSKVRRPNFNIL